MHDPRRAAEMVGYARLIGQDEAATLAALKDLRRAAIDPLLAERKGPSLSE